MKTILLTTGVFEELEPFMEEHPFEFDKELRAFRSVLYPDLYAVTLGPGLKKRKQIRKLLEKLKPELIVNAGLTGVLSELDSLEIGERLKLGTVLSTKTDIVFPGRPGKEILVSVHEPVFEPAKKMDLHLDYKARVCDMEAAPLLELVGSLPDICANTTLVFCKVCGDLADGYKYFKYEEKLRETRRFLFWKRWIGILFFPGGPLRYRKLKNMKAEGLAALTADMHEVLKLILESGGRTHMLDSVFTPH